jgi:hypothetical protein
MRSVLRIVLAVVLGFVIGSAVNMALVTISGKVIAPPAGANVATMEGLKASMHLFEPKHFLFPFLAHALGTLAGSFIAALLAAAKPHIAAYSVGGLFLLGGIANVFMLPGPAWFNAIDLLLAYLPFAWLGHKLANRVRPAARSGA